MEPNIGIMPENRSKVAHLLNVILADEFLLFTKTKNAHWNVKGIALS
jgi:starvation-inducible DNA-binding protein